MALCITVLKTKIITTKNPGRSSADGGGGYLGKTSVEGWPNLGLDG